MISIFRRIANFESMPGRSPIPFPLTPHQFYFFLVSLSWGYFIFSIAHMGHVVIEWPAPLGLISYLRWTYWVALGLLILASVAAFLDASERSRALFVTLALTFGIYVVGLGVLVEGNARDPDSYGNFAIVRDLLRVGHISYNYGEPSATLPRDTQRSDPVGSYGSWPGAHYILATLLLSTGLTESAQVFKYLSLAWPFYLTAVTQAIGSRLGLSAKQTFILSVLPLVSSLGWDAYPASFVGHVLYFLCIMIALSPGKSRANLFLLSVLGTSTIISHAVSGAALFLSTFGLWLIGGLRWTIAALVVMLGGMWYSSFARGFITAFVADLGKFWLRIFRPYFQASTYATVGPPPLGRLTLRYTQLAFYASYALLGLRYPVWMLFRQRGNSDPQMRRAVFGVLVMLVPLALVLPLGEGVPRVIVLGSIWTILLLILTGPRPIIVVACLIIFPILLPFARYAGEGVWNYVASSRLAGAKFFASTVDVPKPPSTFFVPHGVQQLIVYYNSGFHVVVPEEPVTYMAPSALGFDVSRLSDSHIHYVILDKQGHDAMLWSIGYDPFEEWPETEARMVNEVYDNGNFQVYQNVRWGTR